MLIVPVTGSGLALVAGGAGSPALPTDRRPSQCGPDVARQECSTAGTVLPAERMSL
jgi:hypothetical protein